MTALTASKRGIDDVGAPGSRPGRCVPPVRDLEDRLASWIAAAGTPIDAIEIAPTRTYVATSGGSVVVNAGRRDMAPWRSLGRPHAAAVAWLASCWVGARLASGTTAGVDVEATLDGLVRAAVSVTKPSRTCPVGRPAWTAIGGRAVGVVAASAEQAATADWLVGVARRDGWTASRTAGWLQRLDVASLPAPSQLRPRDTRGSDDVGRRGGVAWLRLRSGDALASTGRRGGGISVAVTDRMIAAPYAAMLLREWGASVTVLPPARTQRADRSDLAPVDAVVENYRPAAWRLAEQRVPNHRVRVGIRGFSTTSPCAHWKVYGTLCEAAVGLGSLTAGVDLRWWSGGTGMLDRIVGSLAAVDVARHSTRSPGDAHSSTDSSTDRGSPPDTEISLIDTARRLRDGWMTLFAPPTWGQGR